MGAAEPPRQQRDERLLGHMWGGCSPTSAEDSLPAAIHVTERLPLLAKPDPDSTPLAHHVPAGSFLEPTEMVSLSGGLSAYQVKYEVHGQQGYSTVLGWLVNCNQVDEQYLSTLSAEENRSYQR